MKFYYTPGEQEAEQASNSYLMSLIALMAGLPFPIINLLATVIFYLGNKNGTYYVRWHCTQALVSQLSMLSMISIAFWWTISIIFDKTDISNNYIGYILTILIFNLIEFILTIRTVIETRKGNHVEWWFFGPLTHLICKPKGRKRQYISY